MIEKVAGHLKQQAYALKDADEKDAYGRSSFNRYYYATYLIVRQGLAELDPKWAVDMPHATIPDLLRGRICDRFKDGSKKAAKFNDQQARNSCEKARTAAFDLAKLVEDARFARVAADYDLNMRVDFTHLDEFKLNQVSVKYASSWPSRASVFMKIIDQGWKSISE